MNTTRYALIRRTPFAVVMAHPAPLDTVDEAAPLVAEALYNNALVSKGAAEEYGTEITKLPVGEILDHHSGYWFRLLEADFTSDGAVILPGLTVQTPGLRRGKVGRAQFMSVGLRSPGGEEFAHRYDVHVDGSSGRRYFRAEALTTAGVLADH
jgi:hypothetical protein